MLRHIFLLAILSLTWYLLSGHNTLLLLSLGIVSCIISYYFYQKIVGRYAIGQLNFHPFRLLKYSLWLVKEIIKSNIKVILTVVFNRPISPQFFYVETRCLNQLGKVIYANSITLTPGTITIDIQENRLQVYSLFSDTNSSLENGEMHHQIEQLMKK